MDISPLQSADKDCLFCQLLATIEVEASYKSVVAIADQYPVSEHHLLILPRRHVKDYFSLTLQEKLHADRLLQACKNIIVKRDSSVTGFNIGINCGESAGQTIFHCHIHLIPRRSGDTASPRGGVRGVIPDKMAYPL